MLQVRDLDAGYGSKKVVRGLDFEIEEKSCVGIVGPNGAGKSTALLALFGVIRPLSGRVVWAGHDLTRATPAEHVASGMALVPQGGRVFSDLSVVENLQMGAYSIRDRRAIGERVQNVFSLFPRLGDRRHQRAGSLSGGERQMLALGIALMVRPRLLLLDEPSTGLAPIVVADLMATIQRINQEAGTTVLIVEQNARAILPIVSRVTVMQVGRVRAVLDPAQLETDEQLRAALLVQA